jgi:hypothetical protein
VIHARDAQRRELDGEEARAAKRGPSHEHVDCARISAREVAECLRPRHSPRAWMRRARLPHCARPPRSPGCLHPRPPPQGYHARVKFEAPDILGSHRWINTYKAAGRRTDTHKARTSPWVIHERVHTSDPTRAYLFRRCQHWPPLHHERDAL